MVKIHKDLECWKKSMDMVIDAYRLTNNFPDNEKYGLCSQIQRSAVSIPSNIAEGAARKGNKEFINFLHIALGSLAELETQLEIAFRLNYFERKEFNLKNIVEVRRLTQGLVRYLKGKDM